jgi:hypothetical protein
MSAHRSAAEVPSPVVAVSRACAIRRAERVSSRLLRRKVMRPYHIIALKYRVSSSERV